MNRRCGLFVTILLAAVLSVMLSFCVGARVYGGKISSETDWSFDLYSGTLTISGSGEIPDYPNYIALPYSKYILLVRHIVVSDGITRVGTCSFMNCANVTDVTLSNDVESIGDSAFEYCRSLGFITIPEGVESIGAMAFDNCTKLEGANLPSTLNSIGSYAFSADTSLADVSLSHTSVSVIPEGAFSGCTSLTDLELPESLSIIGEGAFYRCTKLDLVVFPSTLSQIADRAFFGDTAFANCEFTSHPVVAANAFEGTSVGFSVTFENHDGTVLEKCKYMPGIIPSYSGKTPNKNTSIPGIYKFVGWDKTILDVIRDMTYTAEYEISKLVTEVSFTDVGDGTARVEAKLSLSQMYNSSAVVRFSLYGDDGAMLGTRSAVVDKSFTSVSKLVPTGGKHVVCAKAFVVDSGKNLVPVSGANAVFVD